MGQNRPNWRSRASLKLFRKLDNGTKIGVYLTAGVLGRNTLLSLVRRTPPDLVLPLMMNKTTGEPVPSRGALRSQVAALGTPPSWADGDPEYGRSPVFEADIVTAVPMTGTGVSSVSGFEYQVDIQGSLHAVQLFDGSRMGKRRGSLDTPIDMQYTRSDDKETFPMPSI